MATKLTRLTHKIPIQLHLVAESCSICSSSSRRPVRKLLDTPSWSVTCTEPCYSHGENQDQWNFPPVSLWWKHRQSRQTKWGVTVCSGSYAPQFDPFISEDCIKRIVLLGFIHRLVSQEQTKLRKLKIIDKRSQTNHTRINYKSQSNLPGRTHT
jgi:hypothetical protein